MPLEDLINRLENLNISNGKVSVEQVLKTYAASDYSAEDVFKQLRFYLDGVFRSITEAASSVSKLRKVAQLSGKGLLKIAQTGLKNTKGGAEPLQLACDALRALLPLFPFIKTAELAMEKLVYQAIARSVDLGAFSLGLCAATFLQTLLRQRSRDSTGMALGRVSHRAEAGAVRLDVDACLVLVGEDGEDGESERSTLYLHSFEHPDTTGCDSLEKAKLVSGACLNTCRCCLEVGWVEVLELMVGELGRSAGAWINKVSDLGEVTKAEAYRDHLFKLLWKACSSLEQEPLAHKSPSTLEGRKKALELLTGQRESWDTGVFVSMAHRGAVSLERRVGGNSLRSRYVEAAKLSAFCHELLRTREGSPWPPWSRCLGVRGRDGITNGFQAPWVDWLQYSAGLQEKIGDHAAARRLLQSAYEFVREYRQQVGGRVKDGTDPGPTALSCLAYSAILKIHAAVTITSQYPFRQSSRCHSRLNSGTRSPSTPSPTSPPSRPSLQPGPPRESSPDYHTSASTIHGHLSRSLEYAEDLCDSLEELGRSTAEGDVGTDVEIGTAEVDAGVMSAAVKAWKWIQKASGILAQWAEEAKERDTANTAAGTGQVGGAQFSALMERNLRFTADLSRHLATLVEASGRDSLGKTSRIQGMPSARALSETAFDTYLRVVRDFINASSGTGTEKQEGNGTSTSGGCRDGTEVRKCLNALTSMCGNRSGSVPLHGAKRAGVGWFGFGQRLVDHGEAESGLEALLCGSHLLESWLEDQAQLAKPYQELLLSAQLDLRLSRISKILMEVQDFPSACATIARALSYHPDLWRSSSGDTAEPSQGVEALVDRYVACRVRSEGRVVAERQSLTRPPRGDDESVDRRQACLYLATLNDDFYHMESKDGVGVSWDIGRYLQKRGLPGDAVASVLLAECRSYRSHLTMEVTEGARRSGVEDVHVVFTCVTGHRGATEALLHMCKASALDSINGESTNRKLTRADQWKSHAHVLSAWFEHDLFLMKATSTRECHPIDESHSHESNDDTAQVVPDLSGALEHVLLGSDAAADVHEHSSPTSAAVAGVFACLRGLIVRDLAKPGDDVKVYMRRGLDLLNHAIRSPSNGKPEVSWVEAAGVTDIETILACLRILEAHFALQRDTAQMVRSVELRVLFAYDHASGREAVDPAGKAVFESRALSDMGAALHGDGVSAIASSLSTAAHRKLYTSAGVTHDTSPRRGRYSSKISAWTSLEVVRAAAEMLRGLCLGERKGGAAEAEAVLREARRVISEDGRVGTYSAASAAAASAAVAYLQCVAGLGLSWLYERRGRLADAMTELKKVLRLCHAWASSSSTSLSGSDRQVLCLGVECRASARDEQPAVGQSLGEQKPLHLARPEEGIGEESGEVEESLRLEGAQSKGQQGERIVLSSMWLPLYMEGLVRMGRLWRGRGFAWKASGYLRQGCVIAKPLHARHLLRDCLVEEVEVAVRMKRFDRATGLLGACQELLRQERRDRGATGRDAKSDAFVPACSACESSLKLHSVQTHAQTQNGARGATAIKGPGRGARRVTGRPGKAITTPSPNDKSLAEGPCIRCRQLHIDFATLLVVESDVLRRQGEFEAALAACKRGQAALVPLVEVAGRCIPLDCCSRFPEVEALVHRHNLEDMGDRGDKGGESSDIGWRVSELSGALRLQLARVNYLLGDRGTAKVFFDKCAKTEGARVLVRAEALYRLGRMSLDNGDSLEAREPLQRAEALVRGAGAPKLVRRVRRALAVSLLTTRAEGREHEPVAIDDSWRVAALSSLSVGITHCNHVGHLSAKKERNAAKGKRNGNGKGGQAGGSGESGESGARLATAGRRLFGVVSGWMRTEEVAQDELSSAEGFDSDCGGRCLSQAVDCELKAEWTVVSLCLAAGQGATKRLLITRLSRGRPPVTASVSLSREDSELLVQWKEIMDRNRETLRGHSAEEAAGWGNKEKAEWWQARAAVDEAVDTLVHQLQERWLARYGLTPLLMGSIMEEDVEVALRGVCEFVFNHAKGAPRTASGRTGAGAGAVKASRSQWSTRGKLGSRAKCPPRNRSLRTTEDSVQNEEVRKGANGVSELISSCVRGGDVMTDSGWLAVLRLVLSGVRDKERVARELKGKLEERIGAIFGVPGISSVSGRCDPEPSGSSDAGDPSDQSETASLATHDEQERQSERTSQGASVPLRDSETSIDCSKVAKMRVADLRRELAARGVSTVGAKLKSELVAKLIEALRHEACGKGEVQSDGGQKKHIDEDQRPQSAAPLSRNGDGNMSSGKRLGGAKGARGDAATNGSMDGSKQGLPSDHADDSKSGTSDDHSSVCARRRHPVILVLDEELQAMPWEALPCLRGQAVSRVPAVPFVFSALATRWHWRWRREDGDDGDDKDESNPSKEVWMPSQDGFRLRRGFYVLDPESNLPSTQKQLRPVFEAMEQRHGWSGTVGEAPTEERMARVLQEVDVFAYSGHGAGELLIGREAVAALTQCPVAVLMGCSSGRLKGYGEFEPTGMVSSYLAGGSPAVVANLWDVTDRDIDRFSVALLDFFAGGMSSCQVRRGLTLAHAVAQARSECKMPFVIGHAPVCYGIPITVAEEPSGSRG